MAEGASSLRQQGIAALQAGNLDGAISLLHQALEADDGDAASRALLGIAYSQKGLHDQACLALQTAAAQDRGNASIRFNLGMVLERAGNAAGAISAYQEALRLQPAHPQARQKLAALGAAPRAAAPAAPPTPAADAPPPVWGAPIPRAPSEPGAPPAPDQPATPWSSPAPTAASGSFAGAPWAATAPPSVYSQGAAGGAAPENPAGPAPSAGLAWSPPASGSSLSQTRPDASGAPAASPFDPGVLPPAGAAPAATSSTGPSGGRVGGGMPPPMFPGPMPGAGAAAGGIPPPTFPQPLPPLGAAAQSEGFAGSYGGPIEGETVACPRCRRHSFVGPLCQWCSAPLPPPPPPRPESTPPPLEAPLPAYGGVVAVYDDRFDLLQAFKDIGRVLVSPRTFFVEQAEAEGKKAPLAALLALTLLVTIGGAIGNLAATGQFEGKQSIGLFQIPCSLAYTWVVYIASAFLVGGVVHGVSCALGGKGTFDGTFRAVTYSWVPSTVVAIVASPFLVRSASEMEKLGRPPTQLPIQSSAPSATWTTSRSGAPRLVWIRPPVAPAPALLLQRRAPASGAQIQKVLELFLGMVPALVLMGLGCLWGFVLLCLGVAEIHGLGGGSAFGAVLLSAVILGLLGGGVGLALATVLGAALQSAAGGLGK